MKTIILAAVMTIALCACASSGHATAWGKANVSKVDYGTDVGMCTGLASLESSSNGSNTAGGINGSRASTPGATNAGGSLGTLGGGTYTGMASPDLVQRAATQQQSQEMAAKRVRDETLARCLSERGYQQFALTAEQNAELAKLKHGSNEYHEYLYKLGADPAVLSKQATSSAAAPAPKK
jgi:hypothetical protein